MWAEYNTNAIDGDTQATRPFIHGKQSNDGSTIIVRFINGEAPWPNPLQEFTEAAYAAAALNGEAYAEAVPAVDVASAMAAQIKLDAAAKEGSGVTWVDGQGNAYVFGTAPADQLRLLASRNAAQDSLRPEGGVWPCYDVAAEQETMRSMTNAEIVQVADAAYMQSVKVAAAAASALAKLAGGDTTADFATEYAAL